MTTVLNQCKYEHVMTLGRKFCQHGTKLIMHEHMSRTYSSKLAHRLDKQKFMYAHLFKSVMAQLH